ncbi:MAG: SHOCT domain-containing protein [Candidatus Hadarchaeia archaeon]
MFFIVWVVGELVESEEEKTPVEILNERYARGEIDDDEYERRREKLGY